MQRIYQTRRLREKSSHEKKKGQAAGSLANIRLHEVRAYSLVEF